ncbi:hypothetical protein N3K66_003725 [Trichothecium roseum]|uniref:Uncharacterized protein n=1 Tax=Trichothecium roseum TaxID=47278 RepID=A0ACC0V6P0_9HYPO|nr:hypothetical protein N3K66_003725 [Trichothecium roseum]
MPYSPRRYSSQVPGGNTTTTTSTGPSTSLPTTPKTESAIPVPNTVGPLPFWQRLGPLTSLARAYSRAQKRRPWVTQFCTALVIYATADLSAQYINSGGAVDVGPDLETETDPDLHADAAEKQKQSRGFVPDPSRTARSLVIGGIAAIPSYLWFIWLSHNFNYSSRLLSLATKIVVSQILFTPTFNTYFFGMQAALSGCSPRQILDRVTVAVPASVAMSCRFWPPVTAFSFTFVPIQHRSVFAGVIAIGWQTYLALVNRRAELAAAASAATASTATESADVRVMLPERSRLAAA